MQRTDKRCPKCGLVLSTLEFHRHSGKADGFQTICKACMKKCPSQTPQGRSDQRKFTRVCVVCEKTFRGDAKARFCGRECQQRTPWHLMKRRSTKVWFPSCDGCHQTWVARTQRQARQRYCSVFCARKHQTATHPLSKSSKVPKKVVAAVLDVYGRRCVYCGDPEIDALDHKVPRSKGGADVFENLVPACKACNSHKTWRTVDEWAAAMAREIEEMQVRISVFEARLEGINQMSERRAG